MSDQVLLRDLVAIPDTVHDGDFVLTLSKGVRDKSTITDYVVTEPLAANFDKALDLIKSALETGASRAAYLNGSFGSGKSHFMAILHAVLKGDPDARGKIGLADIVAKHDKWLSGRKFLLVPYHLPDSQSLDAAILGGYVAHVAKEHPGVALPAVYRDDSLIADAAGLRIQVGDEKFIDLLPAAGEEAQEWGAAAWDAQSLDQAFAEPQTGKERRRLVGDLLAGPFRVNATLKATLGNVADEAQRVDDLSIRLRADLRPSSWRGVVDAVQDRLCLPEVDEKALTGLKFSEALPRPLAVATLATRLADLDHARAVFTEPTRFER